MNNPEWYVDWFNSPYYHLLYNNRNDVEANFFIDNLCSKLNLKNNSTVWDLACGKGRHAIALNKKGLAVIGTDLSKNSILEASLSSNDTLHFYEHDMLLPFKENYFEAVFNLFTSIGYFQNFEDNFLVFKNVAQSLKNNGVFVIDFFNANKLVSCFSQSYLEKRSDIIFNINKTIQNKKIIKKIEFTIQNKNYFFEETVSLLTKNDFEDFASKANLKLEAVYGNYKLEPFDATNSDRLILIFKK